LRMMALETVVGKPQSEGCVGWKKFEQVSRD
jgi:hypothetical protein